MTGRQPAPSDRPGERAEPRAIPDGGLGEAMPDWLRRPPAWRDLEPNAPKRRRVPPPDTSVIDPATLIAVEDLPAWLQTLARADVPSAATPDTPPAKVERRIVPRVIEASARQRPAGNGDLPPATAPIAPAALSLDQASNERFRTPEPARPTPSNATIVLSTLLAVALVVIVVLLWLLYA